MKDSFVVYPSHSGKKIFESDDIQKAIAFVEKINEKQRRVGNDEFEKYEIVRIRK